MSNEQEATTGTNVEQAQEAVNESNESASTEQQESNETTQDSGNK